MDSQNLRLDDPVLNGRVCLVTGAGQGLGRSHALLLARAGARVAVNDVDAEAAESVVAEIVGSGGEAVASVGSVGDWGQAEAIVGRAVESYGDLHVVINNAAQLGGWSLAEVSEAEFDAVVGVGLKGTFATSRWACRYWRSRTGAGADRAIVNTSSGAGLHGTAGQSHYAAAKAGVAALTQVHAVELAGLGVRVNAVVPVARTAAALEAVRLSGAPAEAGDFLRRPAFDPEHVSAVVAALAAPGCPFTGQLFSVVGGSVGCYAGWSIADEITSPDRWSVPELITAMAGLPRRLPVRTQRELITAAAR